MDYLNLDYYEDTIDLGLEPFLDQNYNFISSPQFLSSPNPLQIENQTQVCEEGPFIQWASKAVEHLSYCIEVCQKYKPDILSNENGAGNILLAHHYAQLFLEDIQRNNRDLTGKICTNLGNRQIYSDSVTFHQKSHPTYETKVTINTTQEPISPRMCEKRKSDEDGYHRGSSNKPYASNMHVFKVTPKSKITKTSKEQNASKLNCKVPSSLSNTAASTMMYHFNLNRPKGKRSKRGTLGTKAPALPINIRDYDFLHTLGIGTYGKVQLVKYKPENTFYCFKILKRYTIFRHKQIEHIQNEKAVLNNVNHPGIVKLFGTYNDQESLYFLLEYVPGGDMFKYIRQNGHLPLHVVKYYAAEIVLILEYLHTRNLIYRDLKPENILLDSNGHIKLTDFGFSKYITDRTWTMCGTPDYLAPEVISGQGHDKSVDWWSLGVLIFEMLAGYPPFTDENTLGIFTKIREPEKLVYPDFFPQEVIDFIRKLLIVDPTRRLGSHIKNGILDIKTQPFFNSISWLDISERKLTPPIKPKLKSPDDVSNFTENGKIITCEVPECVVDVPIPPEVQSLFDKF